MLLTILYLVKGRPLPSRNLAGNLLATFTRKIFDFCAAANLPLLAYDDPQTAQEQYVLVEPAEPQCYAGTITSASEAVKPQPQGVVWFPGPPSSSAATAATAEERAKVRTEKVVLQFVGGAFVMGLGYKIYGQDVFNTYSKHLRADRVVWSDYRISDGSVANKFPAAIQDAVTHYAYVVSLGYDPKNITLAGDSAGGNVVLALLRHLQSLQHQSAPALPLPGGAICFSPWVKVIPTIGRDFHKYKNAKVDSVCAALGQWGVDAYRPEGTLADDIEAFISPMDHPFKTSVPIFIHDGDAEALHDDIIVFQSQMAKVGGNTIRYHCTPVAPHDLLLVHPLYKMTAELGNAVDEAYGFFSAQ